MESDWISTTEDWPTPKSVKDSQVPLGAGEHLPKIRPEIYQGDPSTDGITKDTRDQPEGQERDTSSQMGMEAASRSGVPNTENNPHQGSDAPAI